MKWNVSILKSFFIPFASNEAEMLLNIEYHPLLQEKKFTQNKKKQRNRGSLLMGKHVSYRATTVEDFSFMQQWDFILGLEEQSVFIKSDLNPRAYHEWYQFCSWNKAQDVVDI